MKKLIPALLASALLLSGCNGVKEAQATADVAEQDVHKLEDRVDQLERANHNLGLQIDALKSQIEDRSH